MKRLVTFLLCALVLVNCALYAKASAPKIVDNADLLSDSEEAALESRAQALVTEYGMDVVILTVWEYDGYSVSAYADDYYDSNGYGVGDDFSGVLLVLSMKETDWAISTCGDAIYALTDYGIQSVFSEISWYLSQGQYYFAFDEYLDELDTYFANYANGAPIDGMTGSYDGPGYYEPVPGDDVVYYPDYGTEDVFPVNLFVSLLIGAAAGGVGLLILRGQMNTAKAQNGAKNYMISGTYQLNQQRDIFLYRNVSRTRRAETNHSSGGGRGGRGGSGIHRSSGGRMHGGGRGKF